MTAPVQDHFLQLRSTVLEEGKLQLSLEEVPTPKLENGEIPVRIEASPINPSALGLLFGVADMSTAEASGTSERPVITATIPEKLMGAVKPRIGASLAVGNEGAGVVVAAGKDPPRRRCLGGPSVRSAARCIRSTARCPRIARSRRRSQARIRAKCLSRRRSPSRRSRITDDRRLGPSI